MTATADARPPNSRIRVALIVIAAIESLGALRDIPAIFYDFNPTTPLGKFAQGLGTVDLVLAVPFVLAALYFALKSRLRLAVAALAFRMLVTWLCDLPSIAIHGIEWSLTFGGIQVAAYQIGAPLIALAALYLVRRDERLGLATLLVALPLIVFWLGVIAFGISVMIHGF